MAEGLLQAMSALKTDRRVNVSSAGTHAIYGNRPLDLAVQVMQEWKIDISGHRARMLTKPMVKESDLILVMEKAHLTYIRFMPFFGMKKVRLVREFDAPGDSADVPDPMGGDLEMYRASALLLKDCLKGVRAYLENTLQI